MPRSRPAWSARRTGVISMAAAGVIALTMSGCTGAPEPTPTPSAATDAAEPIFASDEEALAAAEEAYERYVERAAQIGADGGDRPERILDSVTEEYATELIEEYQGLSERGLIIQGESTLSKASLAERSEQGGVADVQVYGCIDVEATRVFDSQGADLTPEGRELIVPVILSFASQHGEPLLLSGSERWAGDDFC